jgi:hypothetical protein
MSDEDDIKSYLRRLIDGHERRMNRFHFKILRNVKIKGIDMKKISSVIFLSFLILFLLVSCEKKSSLEYECDEDCEKESALEAKKFECNKVKPNKKLTIQTSCPRSSVEKCKNQEIGVRNKYGDIIDSFMS